MTMKPRISDDPMYLLLKDGKIAEFNRLKKEGRAANLVGCDFSAMDLRGMDPQGLDFTDSFFHQTDLRGLDLRSANLEGASIHGAHIAGAYFPPDILPDEIEMSFQHGTRMRVVRRP